MRYIVGDLLTGRRIQNLNASSGTWSEVLNDAGELSCTVSLRDPVNQRLGLKNSAAPAKAFLAAVEGDLVLAAGPVWKHDWDDDQGRLTIRAAGMWSYFDYRLVLPVLAGRNPTDPTTDTRYWPEVTDPEADGYPWPTDTRTSLQAMAKQLVEQAQSWTGGDVPVLLPSEEAGDAERWYRGADLGFVGERLSQLTAVDGGPDIMFTPRWTSDRLGVEWVMRIGTPTQPLLFSQQRQKFYIGIAESSVSNLKVKTDGTRIASQGFAVGGRSLDQTTVTIAEDTILTDAGYPLLQAVDSTHSTASEATTLQGYADELVLQGRTPTVTYAFTHDLTQTPKLEAFNAGDFAEIKVTNNMYLEDSNPIMRLLARSGDIRGQKVALTFAPVVT